MENILYIMMIKQHHFDSFFLPSSQHTGTLSTVISDLEFYFISIHFFQFNTGGGVAWWLTPRTPDPKVRGSNPTQVAVLCP